VYKKKNLETVNEGW